MTYVESNLMPGEKVVYRAHLHGIVYASAVVVAVVGLLFWIGVSWGAGLAFLFVAAVGWLGAYIKVRNSEFVVTDQRVLIKVGWLQRRSLETFLSKVEGIGVEQGLDGRMWGYGTIIVTGTGGTHERFTRIADPLEFRKQIQEQTATTQRTRTPVEALPVGRDERECPYCAERILARAKLCKHCGREVPPLTA